MFDLLMNDLFTNIPSNFNRANFGIRTRIVEVEDQPVDHQTLNYGPLLVSQNTRQWLIIGSRYINYFVNFPIRVYIVFNNHLNE